MMLSSMQGTPLIGADILDDRELTDFAGRMAQLRNDYRRLLFPITFDADWQINWYGAHPGMYSPIIPPCSASGVYTSKV